MSSAHITVIGHLGRDPETRFTKSGQLNVTFSVAASRKRTDQNGVETEITNWYRVTAWGKQAELLDRLTQEGALAKGGKVVVIGRFEVTDYTDRDGNPRYSLDVNATTVELASARAVAARDPGDLEDLPF